MNVCLIPARGGSKRIPRKNIREFRGKPMIAWSIEAAERAGCFGSIIVSTDDAEIAEVARRYGAAAPFERPKELADDHTTTAEVVRHALDWLESQGGLPAALCCLYATAPFVTPDDILAGRARLEQADFSLPITSFGFPIQRAVRITAGGGLEMLWPEHQNTRSQDLEEAYHDTGQFYWGKIPAWRSEFRAFGPDSSPIILPRWRVQDIDTPEDWTRAELLHQLLTESGHL